MQFQKPDITSETSQVKCCHNCKYHQHEDITDGWICVNGDSEYIADWTEFDDTCEDWEER